MKTYAKFAVLLMLFVALSIVHIPKSAAQATTNTTTPTTTVNTTTSSTTSSSTTSSSTTTSTADSTISTIPSTASSTSSSTSTTSTSTSTAATTTTLPVLQPTVSISPTTLSADIGQTITLNANPTGGVGPYTYNWYDTTSGSPVLITGQTGPTFTETATTAGTFTYEVAVTDLDGMSATSGSASVVVSPAPAVSITPLLQSQEVGHQISIVATISNFGSGGDTYQWYNGSLSDPVVSQTNVAYIETADEAGTFSYLVVVTDSNHDIAQSNLAWVTVSTPQATTPTSSTVQSTTVTSTVSSVSTTTTIPATTTIKQSPQLDLLVNSSYYINSTAPKIIPIPDTNTTLYLESLKSNSLVHVVAINLTNNILPFPGYSPIIILNLNVSSSTSLDANVIIKYQCSLPSNALTPYYNTGSSWQSFSNYTVNSTACTVKFSIPKDPIIGLFEYDQANATGTHKTATQSPPQTNKSTDPPTNTITKGPGKSDYPLAFIPLTSEAIGAIVVVAVLIAIFIYMSKPSPE